MKETTGTRMRKTNDNIKYLLFVMRNDKEMKREKQLIINNSDTFAK